MCHGLDLKKKKKSTGKETWNQNIDSPTKEGQTPLGFLKNYAALLYQGELSLIWSLPPIHHIRG